MCLKCVLKYILKNNTSTLSTDIQPTGNLSTAGVPWR